MHPDSSPETLARLLDGIQRGQPDALAALYERTSAQLFAVLIRILRRKDLAEEALQDVFVSIWRKAGSYRPARGPAMGWLVSMARYRAIDLKRRGGRELLMDDIPAGAQIEPQATPVDPAGPALFGLDKKRLDDCMASLSEGQRRGIRLAYFQGLTQEEVARETGSPLGTVKSWIRRGLQALKDCLSK